MSDCASCCILLSSFGVILLLLFGAMFTGGAVTFHIYAIEKGWDMSEKAQACYTGAAIYAATLVVSVLYKIYFSKKSTAA
mmetsp:Transcript_70699/g.82362  ORF Transcript_70699/g.82362 Transcript_70699/m.82362 type:complete len:80 (+) Transcript_70699:244-483(+)